MSRKVKLNANNKMGALETAIKRTAFNVRAYRGYFGPDAVKDFRFGERMSYGRLNQYNRPIIFASDSRLKIPKSAGDETILLADFVADALDDMFKKIRMDMSTGILNADDVLISNLKPKRGYVSPNRIYEDQNASTYEAFKVYIKKYRLTKKIRNIDDFYLHFEELQRLLIDLGFPYTMSAFVKSRRATPHISGLVVDLDDYDFADDSKKADFINGPNFEYYANLALKYGFSIDKHIPTRLVADLASPFMKKYMNKYNVNSVSRTIQSYYDESYLTSYKAFKRNMIGLYNQYVTEKPFVSSQNRQYKKQRASIEKEIEKKGESFYINMYIDLRAFEEQNIDHAKKEYLKKRANDLREIKGLPAALFYIENEYCKPSTEANSYRGIIKRFSST
jgi:hypothetical protein